MENNNEIEDTPQFIPEFLELYWSPPDGDGKVRAHFSTQSGFHKDSLYPQTFRWSELHKIFNPVTRIPYEIMSFDDRFMRVDDYKISVAKKQLTIVVGEPLIATEDFYRARNLWRESTAKY